MCDSSDFKEENGYYVCQICGNKIPVQSKADKQSKQSSEKQKKPLPDRLIRNGLIFLVLGIVLLLGIAIIGSAVYGRAYFFDGYFITRVLTTVAIIWIVGGFITIIVGLLMKFSQK